MSAEHAPQTIESEVELELVEVEVTRRCVFNSSHNRNLSGRDSVRARVGSLCCSCRAHAHSPAGFGVRSAIEDACEGAGLGLPCPPCGHQKRQPTCSPASCCPSAAAATATRLSLNRHRMSLLWQFMLILFFVRLPFTSSRLTLFSFNSSSPIEVAVFLPLSASAPALSPWNEVVFGATLAVSDISLNNTHRPLLAGRSISLRFVDCGTSLQSVSAALPSTVRCACVSIALPTTVQYVACVFFENCTCIFVLTLCGMATPRLLTHARMLARSVQLVNGHQFVGSILCRNGGTAYERVCYSCLVGHCTRRGMLFMFGGVRRSVFLSDFPDLQIVN